MKKIFLIISILFVTACENERCDGIEIRDALGNVIDCAETPENPFRDN